MKMQIKQFNIGNRSGRLFVQDQAGNSLEFQPGDSQALISLVGTAASLMEFPALPPSVASHPFEVHFTAQGTCLVTRVDGESRCEFDKTNFDNFIEAVEVSVNNFVDAKRINKAKTRKVRQHGFNYPDPVF